MQILRESSSILKDLFSVLLKTAITTTTTTQVIEKRLLCIITKLGVHSFSKDETIPDWEYIAYTRTKQFWVGSAQLL